MGGSTDCLFSGSALPSIRVSAINMSPPPHRATRLTGNLPARPRRGHRRACVSTPAPVWLVVAEDLKAAESLAEDIAFFHAAAGDGALTEVLVFPESMPDNRDMREAFAASSEPAHRPLQAPCHAQPGLPPPASHPPPRHRDDPAALLQPVPALEAFATRELTLTRGRSNPSTASES